MNLLSRANPFLAVKEISDAYIRKNFQNLADYFSTENQLLGFKFLEVTFTEKQEGFAVAHGLGYIPQDIIVTKAVGDVNIAFNRGKFTDQTISMTVDAPCTVAFFVGTYWNLFPRQNPADTDIQYYSNKKANSTASVVTTSTTLKKVKVKPLPTNRGTQANPDVSYYNLTIGKWYRISAKSRTNTNVNSGVEAGWRIYHDGVLIGATSVGASTADYGKCSFTQVVFKATATSVLCDTQYSVIGDNTMYQSYTMLEEVDDRELVTNDWDIQPT